MFSVRETRIGMVADVGTLQRLPRIVGDGAARELIFTGRDIDAARAREIGLVSEVLADAARRCKRVRAKWPPISRRTRRSRCRERSKCSVSA